MMTTVFFQRVEALCHEKGMTVTDLAPAADIGNGTVTGWRKGAEPRISTVAKLAAFFSVSVAYLTGKTDDPIDYAKVDTSEFSRTTYDHILKKCKGNIEQANKEYLEFEKAQAQDALSDPDRLAIYQNIGENGNVTPLKVVNSKERALSDQESELLRIFSELSVVQQSKVLVYAAELRTPDTNDATSVYRLAAREGKNMAELTPAQRRAIGKVVKEAEKDDNSDLY